MFYFKTNMRITPVLINLYQNKNKIQTEKAVKVTPPPNKLNVDTVNFSARISERFSKEFLKAILQYGLPCPICNKHLIPLEVLNNPAVDILNIFEKHLDDMTEINKAIFLKISSLAPIHPQKNMQDILKMLSAKAEKKLIIEQNDVLNSIHMLKGEVPLKKVAELNNLISGTRDILLQRNTQKQKFKRKSAISLFDDFALTLSDDNLRVKVMKTIRDIPTSSNNQNAFIVKYARRSPEEIGMKIYNKDFGTLEHIIPDSEGGRIVIWECSEDNGNRGNKSIIQQLQENPQMPDNLQKHANRLIEMYYDEKVPPIIGTQKNLLKEYIFTIRNEYAIASSKLININIDDLGEIPAYMINREIKRISNMKNTSYLRELYKMLQEKK